MLARVAIFWYSSVFHRHNSYIQNGNAFQCDLVLDMCHTDVTTADVEYLSTQFVRCLDSGGSQYICIS